MESKRQKDSSSIRVQQQQQQEDDLDCDCDCDCDSPPSLFSTCLRLVADNAHSVDSFQDFPEDIAKQIWKQIKTEPKDDDDDDNVEVRTTRARLFCSAYPHLVLPGLRVTCRSFLDTAEGRVYPRFVTKLDLANMDLGDCHGVIRNCHSFPHLRTLILRKNGMTSRGARNMVGPFYSAKNRRASFSRLRYLDLSLNPELSVRDLERFAVLPALEVILFSMAEGDVSKLSRLFATKFRTETGLAMERVSTEGWAAEEVTRAQEEMLPKWEAMRSHCRKSPNKQYFPKKTRLYFFTRRC